MDRPGTCIILDKKYNIANSSCHFGSNGSIWTGPIQFINKDLTLDKCVKVKCTNYVYSVATSHQYMYIGECMTILVLNFNGIGLREISINGFGIANSSWHWGSYGSIWTGPLPKRYYIFPYLSLLAQPVTIFVYGPVVYGPARYLHYFR
jgi:hypothetical protein